MANSKVADSPVIIVNLFFDLFNSNEVPIHQNLTHSFFSVKTILTKVENAFSFQYFI